MGGILALKASEKLHPDAIVLVNSVGPAGVGHRKPKSHPRVVEWSKGTLKETRDSMPDSDEATIQFAFHHWRDESGAVLDEISKGIPALPPMTSILVVLGDQDTDVPNAVGEQMAKQFRTDLKVYRGMSHVGPLLGTRAPEVATDVLTWLDSKIR
jgi:esterase/lipase